MSTRPRYAFAAICVVPAATTSRPRLSLALLGMMLGKEVYARRSAPDGEAERREETTPTTRVASSGQAARLPCLPDRSTRARYLCSKGATWTTPDTRHSTVQAGKQVRWARLVGALRSLSCSSSLQRDPQRNRCRHLLRPVAVFMSSLAWSRRNASSVTDATSSPQAEDRPAKRSL